jgi:anion-transporting  ArsA/GET3 family ATPase
LAQALGLTGSTGPGEIVPVWSGEIGRLDALVLDPGQVFDEMVRRCARDAATADALLQNRIYRTTAQRLGGALEYAAMSRLLMLRDDPRYDFIVLDTAPTANAIQFLEAPRRVRDLVDNPVAWLLSGPARIGGRIVGLGAGVLISVLERIAGGSFLADLGRFMRDFAAVLAEFQRRAGDFEALLRSEATGIVLVTTPSGFCVREAEAFVDVLRQSGLHVDGVLLNRFDDLVPPAAIEPFPPAALARLAAAGIDGELAARRAATIYDGLRAQGERASAARARFEGAYPELPLWICHRRDPPPSGLADLRALGREVFGGAPP